MSEPSTTLATIRQESAAKIYAGRDLLTGTTTTTDTWVSVAGANVIDSLLAPAGQLEDFLYAWILISADNPASRTTLSGNHTAATTSITLVGGTVFAVGDGMKIESEVMRVTVVNGGNNYTVVRGVGGTTAAAHSTGVTVYICGPQPGETVRVTNVNFSGSNSLLIVQPSFSCNLLSGQTYEIHYKWRPTVIRSVVNELLEGMRHPVILPLSKGTDHDMETTGTAAWTASTATLSKVTTDTYVARGRQSLKVLATAANGQAQSTTIDVDPGSTVLVRVDAYITPGDSAKVSLIDVTNSNAVIDYATSAKSGWVTFAFRAALPSTCEQVALWLEAVANTDIVYFNAAPLIQTDEAVYDYPTLLHWEEDFEEVFYFPLGTGLSGTGDRYAWRSRYKARQKWSESKPIRDDTAARPFQIEILKMPLTEAPFIQGRINYATLSADTDATVCPKDILVELTFAVLLDKLALEDLEAGRNENAQAKFGRAIEIRKQLGPRLMMFAKPRGKIQGAMRSQGR